MWAQSAIVPVFMQDATAGFEWVVGSPDPAAGVVPGDGVAAAAVMAMQVEEPLVRMTSFSYDPDLHFITPERTCRTFEGSESQVYCGHS